VPPINDPASITKLNLFEQYSAAAYCKDVVDTKATLENGFETKVLCKAGNCPLVEAAETVIIHTFNSTGDHNVAGFLVADKTNNVMVLSFRGSVNYKNWIDNFKALPVDWQCDGCQAHLGFAQSWDAVATEIEDSIYLHRKKFPDAPLLDFNKTEFPDYPIIVTGHSYGAAVATLAAVELRDLFYPTPVVGSPLTLLSSLPHTLFGNPDVERHQASLTSYIYLVPLQFRFPQSGKRSSSRVHLQAG